MAKKIQFVRQFRTVGTGPITVYGIWLALDLEWDACGDNVTAIQVHCTAEVARDFDFGGGEILPFPQLISTERRSLPVKSVRGVTKAMMADVGRPLYEAMEAYLREIGVTWPQGFDGRSEFDFTDCPKVPVVGHDALVFVRR